MYLKGISMRSQGISKSIITMTAAGQKNCIAKTMESVRFIYQVTIEIDVLSSCDDL